MAASLPKIVLLYPVVNPLPAPWPIKTLPLLDGPVFSPNSRLLSVISKDNILDDVIVPLTLTSYNSASLASFTTVSLLNNNPDAPTTT